MATDKKRDYSAEKGMVTFV